MAEPIALYLATLEKDLRGRIPSESLASILDESASHLHDLSRELGSEEKAVAKFGRPRRYARKILQDATPIPNPWRAVIPPFTIFTLYYVGLALCPTALIEKLVMISVGGFPGIAVAQFTATLLVLFAFIRARQVLLKPLLVLLPVLLFVSATVLFTFGSRVKAVGFDDDGMIVSRKSDGLKTFNESVSGELVRLRAQREQLERGINFFRPGANPRIMPEEFSYYGAILNPQTIVATLTIQDQPVSLLEFLLPFFPGQRSAGGADHDFATASVSWQQNGRPALARVEREIARYNSLLASAPAAFRQPAWAAWLSHLPRSATVAVQGTVMLLYLNLLGWLIWTAFRRFRLPRRRYA